MAQSHNCAYPDEKHREFCNYDEPCQYMLTTVCHPLGPHLCGKDQLVQAGA